VSSHVGKKWQEARTYNTYVTFVNSGPASHYTYCASNTKINWPSTFRKRLIVLSVCVFVCAYIYIYIYIYIKPIKHSAVKSKVKSDCVSPPEFLIQRLLQHYWNHAVYLMEFI